MFFIFLCLFLIFNTPASEDCLNSRTPLNRFVPDQFGLVQFDIRPGYKKVLVDGEFVIADAENVLLTSGLHILNIISIPGYADTTLVFKVEKDFKIMMVVELRESYTEKILRLTREKKKTDKKKLLIRIFKANMIIFGGIATGTFGHYCKEKDAWPLAVMSAGSFTVVMFF